MAKITRRKKGGRAIGGKARERLTKIEADRFHQSKRMVALRHKFVGRLMSLGHRDLGLAFSSGKIDEAEVARQLFERAEHFGRGGEPAKARVAEELAEIAVLFTMGRKGVRGARCAAFLARKQIIELGGVVPRRANPGSRWPEADPGARAYIVGKKSRDFRRPYTGPTCEKIGIKETPWFARESDAQAVARELSAHNRVGFEVKMAVRPAAERKTNSRAPSTVTRGGKTTEVKNLGWLLRHAARVAVDRIELSRYEGTGMQSAEGRMRVTFIDGAVYESDWASYALAIDWVHRPVLRGARLVVDGVATEVANPITREAAAALAAVGGHWHMTTFRGPNGKAARGWHAADTIPAARPNPAGDGSFRAVAIVYSDGGVVHPDCEAEATKPADSRLRGRRVDAERSAWPAGKACVVCGGKTATPRRDNPVTVVNATRRQREAEAGGRASNPHRPRAASVPNGVTRVEVYRNLHTETWSVRDMATGRVVAHPKELFLTDVDFVVGQAGREKVVRDKRKNVHAVIRGTVARDSLPADAPWTPVTYNPYQNTTFVERESGEQLHCARAVHLRADMKVLAILETDPACRGAKHADPRKNAAAARKVHAARAKARKGGAKPARKTGSRKGTR